MCWPAGGLQVQLSERGMEVSVDGLLQLRRSFCTSPGAGAARNGDTQGGKAATRQPMQRAAAAPVHGRHLSHGCTAIRSPLFSDIYPACQTPSQRCSQPSAIAGRTVATGQAAVDVKVLSVATFCCQAVGGQAVEG